MMKFKLGGMILTGLGAFLIADKALSVIERSVGMICQAKAYKEYYRCCSDVQAPSEDAFKTCEDDFMTTTVEAIGKAAEKNAKKKSENAETAKDEEVKEESKDIHEVIDEAFSKADNDA